MKRLLSCLLMLLLTLTGCSKEEISEEKKQDEIINNEEQKETTKERELYTTFVSSSSVAIDLSDISAFVIDGKTSVVKFTAVESKDAVFIPRYGDEFYTTFVWTPVAFRDMEVLSGEPIDDSVQEFYMIGGYITVRNYIATADEYDRVAQELKNAPEEDLDKYIFSADEMFYEVTPGAIYYAIVNRQANGILTFSGDGYTIFETITNTALNANATDEVIVKQEISGDTFTLEELISVAE